MEPTSTASSPVDAPARLSFAQKRDLLGQAVAAVVTTALIAAPLMSPAPDGGTGMPLAALPANSFAAPVAAVAVTDVAGLPGPRPLSIAMEPRRTLRGTRLTSAALTPVATQGSSTTEVDRAAVAPRESREQPRKPLTRRLTGWLTGSGTHAVRPFPTIPTGRP